MKFGSCFICGGFDCRHREPAVDAAWLEVLGRLQPAPVALPIQTAPPVVEQPRKVPQNAAEAVRWYILATGEVAADGIGDPDGWVTVEEVGA